MQNNSVTYSILKVWIPAESKTFLATTKKDLKILSSMFLYKKKFSCQIINTKSNCSLKSESVFVLISGEDDKTFPSRQSMALYAS